MGGPVTLQGSLWGPWLQYFLQCFEGGMEDVFIRSVEMQLWVTFAARKLAGVAAEGNVLVRREGSQRPASL